MYSSLPPSSPYSGCGSDIVTTSAPYAFSSRIVALLDLVSVTQMKFSSFCAASMASATPRLPDDDSMNVPPGARRFEVRAEDNILRAALILTDPARFSASHLSMILCPSVDDRSR